MRISTARLLPRLRLSVVGALVSAFAFAGVTAAWAAPGSWASLAPVPAVGSGVEGMSVAATSTGRIVAAYGFDNGFGDTRRTRVYNIQRDVWTIAAQAPAPPRSEGTAVSRGTFVYSIGGRGPVGVLADLDRFDVWTNTWRSLADMPTARAGLGAAILGPEIYVIGGRTTCAPCSGGELRSVERYDIRSNTWVRLAPLPTARSDAAAATVNGKIYVFGGCRVDPSTGQVTFLRDVDIYSPATNTWSRAPRDLPAARAAFYQVAVLGAPGPTPRIYAIGGWDGVTAGQDTVFIYNVTKNAYTQGTRMPTPRAEMGVAVFRGRIYAVGGAQPAFGASVDAHEVFQP